jgi:molybdate/tungstate transport system substrate-binding protein
MNRIRLHFYSLLVLLLSSTVSTATAEEIRGELILFHAGSLTVPMNEIIRQFSLENPGVEVRREIAGSRTCARKISELGRACDVLASADYRVIENLMIPGHADWNIQFATNELVLACRNGLINVVGLNIENLFDRILQGRISYGRSDPDSDPCGYRTVLAFRLTGMRFKRPGMADSLLAVCNRYIRPKETDLLALVEMEEIDCLFIYRSVAEQHNLEFIELPAEINLGEPALAEVYQQVWVDISGKNPNEKIRVNGEAMVYGITIPHKSPNPAAAMAFVRYVLDVNRGMHILQENGQQGLIPARSTSGGLLPPELSDFVIQD